MPFTWRVKVVLLLVAGFLLAACSSAESDPTSSLPANGGTALTCSEPPPDQIAAVSPSDMALEPNPVRAGQLATVIVAPPPVARPIMGVDLNWTCWDGSQWTMTHKLVTDDVTNGPWTLAHPPPPGVTTTIPDAGVALPSSSGIVVPAVSPGIYRLQTGRPIGESIIPFVLVEVIP